MKKHFYSLWSRMVLAFFWTMVITFLIMGISIYILNSMEVWDRFMPSGINMLLVLAGISILFGTILSLFLSRHALTPISALADAMQKVAQGDYTVHMEPLSHKGEILHLYENFNQMVQELNSTETLHADFISNVSHEFKTPLAAISGYATLLQDDSLSPEERDEYVETIIASARDLSKMTGNILSLSRLENQTIISEKEEFRVDEQIRQIILRMEPAWSSKNLDINPELGSILWYGNRELSSHIWTNLLDNAIKFTAPGGAITVTAAADSKWLTVTFQDTGIGMSSDIQEHIFDKFYQGDVSHQKKGNGLGLPLVSQIVALHGGTIQVESYPELGSSFTVRLPMDSPETVS